MVSGEYRLSDVRWLPAIAFRLLLLAAVGRRLPLPRLVRLFDRGPSATLGRRSAQDIARYTRVLQAVLARVYVRDFCFPRTLLLYHFLAGRGRSVHLVFGIRREGRRLVGHAWLEMDGEPFAEPQDPRASYRATFIHPPNPTRLSDDANRTQGGNPDPEAEEIRPAGSGAARAAA